MRKASRILMITACGLLLGQTISWASTYPLENILPEDGAKKLAQVGIKDSANLLDKGLTPATRKKLAKDTAIDLKLITEWVRMCDLLRIKGIGPVMVKLLKATEVISVAQLRQRNAKSLYDAIIKANAKVEITKNPPSEQHLENWIGQAKQLKIVLR